MKWLSVLSLGLMLVQSVWSQDTPPVSKRWESVHKIQYKAPSNEPINLIVQLETPSIAAQLKAIGPQQTKSPALRPLLRSWSQKMDNERQALFSRMKTAGKQYKVTRDYRYLVNGLALSAVPSDMETLRSMPGVKAVYRDTRTTGHTSVSVPRIGAPDVWVLKNSQDQLLRGEGMVIAIIDSGVDYTHPDLGGGFGPGFKVIGGYDLVDNDADPMDEHGHGTHVAGIAAANGTIVGVAPDASLLAYRVLNAANQGVESDILAALELASDPDGDPITNDQPHVINLSLGGESDENSILAQAVNQAVEAGIVVVASAGNSGIVNEAIRAPGAAQLALTVGAVTNIDQLTNYTSRGPVGSFGMKPDLSAPGDEITSTLPGGQVGVLSGSSMSAPHVAGAAALVRQMYPSWDAERVSRRLVNTARLFSLDIFARGAGMVNLLDAIVSPLEFNARALNFGDVDKSQSSWINQKTIEITNISTQSQAFDIRAEGNLSTGWTVLASPRSIDLDPGETVEVVVRAIVTNSLNAFPQNVYTAYLGQVVAVRDLERYGMNYAMRKSHVVTMDFKTGGLYNYRLSNESFIADRIDRVDPGGEPKEVHMPPGRYRIMGYGDISEEGGEGQVYLIGEEDLRLFSDQTLTYDASTAISPDLHVTDLNGQRKSITEMKEKTTNYVLTHIPSLGTSTANFSLQVKGDGPQPVVSSMSDEFHLEVLGLFPILENGDQQFAEFGYRMLGTGGGVNFENDLRTYKHITYDYRSIFGVNPLVYPEYRANSLQSGSAFFGVDTLAPDYSLEAPFQLTILAMPQGNPGEDESLYSQTIRSFRVDEFDLETFKVRTLQTGRYRPIDNSQMAFMELDSISPEDLFTTTSDHLSMGDSLIYPNFDFSHNDFFFTLSLRSTFGTGLFMDPWQNGIETPNLTFSLFDEERNIVALEGDNEDFHTLLPTREAFQVRETQFTFTMNYEGQFNGQSVDSHYTAHMDLTEGNGTPPWIHQLYVEQNGDRSQILTGSSTLVMELGDENTVDAASLEINSGSGWSGISLTRDENTFRGNLPNFLPGAFVSLRIKAEDGPGNDFELVMEDALRSGYFYVIPWVVNNSSWSSRISIANTSNQQVSADLEALTTDGLSRKLTIEIPPEGVYAAQAGDLFPDISGYRLKINTPSKALYPSFLTFNIEETSGGNSPSQTTAAFSEDLNARLLFPYLPGDQLPAIVLCAPGRDSEGGPLSATTPVTLNLYDNQLGVIATKTITLTGSQPTALLVKTLFEDVTFPQHGTIEALAGNGTHLAGTTFTFNQQREPSMASGVSRPHEPANGQVIPWVVNNSQWNSRIAVYNKDFWPHYVEFTAVTSTGETLVEARNVSGNTVLAWEADELFPNLSGYSISIEVDFGLRSKVFASFLTFNKEAQSGGNSPSQTTGTLPGEQSSDLIFGYLPTGEISAIVLTAPGVDGPTTVTLTAFGSDQGKLGETNITLTGSQPYAALVNDLFANLTLPENVAIRATSNGTTKMAGTAFIFNSSREPSMAKPFKAR